MSNVPDFPVTTPFGWVPGYPLNNGYHNGIDYGCPVGTTVIVNGVTIGLTGNTGSSTGPHCHVGRWVGGKATDPGVGGGFTFQSAVVTEINEDNVNGKYVRVQGDGASWVYLHLSNNQLVSVGQELEGGEMAEPIIDNTNEARQIALEYGWEIAGDDPYLGRAVGKTELQYRTELAPSVKNIITQRTNELAEAQAHQGNCTPDEREYLDLLKKVSK